MSKHAYLFKKLYSQYDSILRLFNDEICSALLFINCLFSDSFLSLIYKASRIHKSLYCLALSKILKHSDILLLLTLQAL